VNFRVTGIMLAVLVVLGATVWWFELREPAKASDNATAAMLGLKAEDVTRLETRDQSKVVVVEKSDAGTWRLLNPEEAEADGARVDDMVNRIATLKATRTIDDAIDLASYGLAQPATQAIVASKTGETITVLIGDKTPDGSSHYVKRDNGPTVYLISSYVVSDLSRFTNDPPKPRPTPTPAPALATPAGGLTLPPLTITPTP
jgi:hypothetical protein